ncbi:hypothetical protein B9Z19DRAFT_1121588 [Tuber borchii]|uniref:Uncharacterized protein n=1 Tax=Tuber borchii TaxID=42251 RepID=A0A2T7A258_TUBBO|nr:hypothetical protein B9Z19DRAFT_1121588 [Tuber borchii]
MSRLFVNPLYLTPLLAVRQSPRCRFPIRSFNSSANAYSSMALDTVQNSEAPSNTNLRKLWTPRGEVHLIIDQVYKLEDRDHGLDYRFIPSVKDSAASEVDGENIGDMGSKMGSKMGATMEELLAERRAYMAKLFADIEKIRVERKAYMAGHFADMERCMWN